MGFQSFPMEFQIDKISDGIYKVLLSNGDFYNSFLQLSPVFLIEYAGQVVEKHFFEHNCYKKTDKMLLVSVKNFKISINLAERKSCNLEMVVHLKDQSRYCDYISTEIVIYDQEQLICCCSLVHFLERKTCAL